MAKKKIGTDIKVILYNYYKNQKIFLVEILK